MVDTELSSAGIALITRRSFIAGVTVFTIRALARRQMSFPITPGKLV
jgi:hypothetical protein